jgi:hypothetical protein
MPIQTNDSQKVKIDYEMFTDDEYQQIHLFLATELDHSTAEINREVWDSRLFEGTQGHTEITIIEDEWLTDLIINRMIERFNTTLDISKYNVMLYKSQGLYNVNWHDDGDYAGAASIYLNKYWNRTLGGYFIYQMSHQDVMTAIQPKQGTAVYQQGGVLHATTPVALNAPNRLSIQVFVNE